MSREALVVGINNYGSDALLKNLKVPAGDAEAIARILTEYGDFHVQRLPEAINQDNYKEQYPIRVGSSDKMRVPLQVLEAALERLFVPSGNNPTPKTALFYFAGHGLRKEGVVQYSYLATSDVAPTQNNWGLSFTWLRDLLRKSPIEEQIILLDCCYSGNLKSFLEEDNINPKDRSQVKRYVITACRDYEVAYEEVERKHGILTKALLEGLNPSDRGVVRNNDLTEFIKDKLKGVPQKPVFFNTGGEILLTGIGATYISEKLGGKCPYKGLEFFDYKEDDPKYFYGRTQLTDELLQHVKEKNFLAILGSSGSGKSSVLRAGLIHQIHLGQRISGTDAWKTYVFRPGEDPLVRLAEVFVPEDISKIEAAEQLNKAKDLIDAGSQGLEALVRTAAKTAESENGRVILAIDQFEELFTICQDRQQRKHFLTCILETLDKVGDLLCVVLTMRIDLVKECEEYPELAKRIAAQESHIIVRQMSDEELEDAIVEPAKGLNASVDRELVTQMLDDVEGPGSLALLQYTLRELWENRTVNRLALSAYIGLGGVKGALKKRADEIYGIINNKSLSEEELATRKKDDNKNELLISKEEQLAAKRIFLELTQLGEGKEDTRRQVLQSKLVTTKQSADLVERVVQKLVNARLLVTNIMQARSNKSDNESDTEAKIVDIAHEALIRHWGELRQWLDDYRDAIRIERKIEAAADEWAGHKETINAAAFLLQGARLVEAENFLNNDELGLLEPLAQEFIQESKALREQQEAARQQEEREKLETQAALEAKEKETLILEAANQKANKKIRYGNVYLAVSMFLGAIFLGSAVIAINKQIEAQKGTQLEQAGVNSLFQFKSGELSSLVSAIQSTQDLQKLIGNKNNPKDYPAASPVLALQKILDDIHEQNYFDAGQGDVKGAVFLPDGKSFITAGEGKENKDEGKENKEDTLQIWNLAGKKEASLQGHEGGLLSGVNAVSVGGNAQNPVIASAGEDGTVRLWNKSGQQIKQLVAEGKPNYDSFTAIAVTPDGQKIIAGKGNGTVYLWDKSGKQLKTWVAHGKKVTAISFSKNGQTLATSGNDGLARIWTVTGNKQGELKHLQIKRMLGVSLSPDGKFVATASDDNQARIWTVNGQEVRRLEGHQGWVTVVNFSPNGQSVATGSDDGSVKLWNAKTGENLQDFRGHRGAILSASFSLDGKRLVSAGKDGFVRLWNLADRPLQGLELTGFKDDVNAIAFSPDGKTIAGAGNEGIMRLWDATSGKELKVWKEAIQRTFNSPNNVQDIAFSPDGKFIVAGGLRIGIARVWNLAGSLTEPQVRLKGKEEKQEAHQNSIRSVAVSPDSQLIATGSHDKTMRIWKPNSPNGELVAVIPAQEGIVSRVLFTADGRRIVTADWEGNVAIWDLAGQLIRQKKVHSTQIRGLGITKDGKWIVTADLNGNVKILDDSGSTKREFFSYQSGINELTVSPDGQLIATGGMDGTVKLWDFQGRQVAEFRNPKGWIWGIAFSPDGKRIALAGEGGFVSVKSIEPLSDLMKEGCSWLHNYLTLHPSENNGLCQ